MTPEQRKIQDLERRIKQLEDFALSFRTPAQLDPQIALTITRVVGDITLDQLSDVIITTPSGGQVLKYNGTVWANGTDNV